MRDVPFAPRLHLFVCANRRVDSDLGPGCGAAGDAVFDVLKAEVASHGRFADIWVTKTQCLGVCPPAGTTVAAYRGHTGSGPLGLAGTRLFTEVRPGEAAALFSVEVTRAGEAGH